MKYSARINKRVIREDFEIMAEEILLTKEGYDKLNAELNELKTKGRDDIAEKIKVALSYGDLSENSEYDEAKNEQGKMEHRIN